MRFLSQESNMAKKRKASSKAFPHHEERSSKRREMPAVSGGNTTSEHANPGVVEMRWRDKETQGLAYLDVSQSSTGILERGQTESTGQAPVTGDRVAQKDNGSKASG